MHLSQEEESQLGAVRVPWREGGRGEEGLRRGRLGWGGGGDPACKGGRGAWVAWWGDA